MSNKSVPIIILFFTFLYLIFSGNIITADNCNHCCKAPGCKTPEFLKIVRNLDDTSDAYTELSNEKNKILYDSTATVSPYKSGKESLIAYIPESEWRTPDLKGRELSLEIAEKYPPGKFITRKVENTAWNVGEHLTFAIEYGFYNAGKATMSVLDKKEINGGICYHIQSTASSNKFISKFYKVRDKVNSYIDVDGLFSRRLEKNLREGRYKSERIVDFYHDRLIALNTREKYAFAEITMYVQDILSALYYLRTMDLQVGKTETIDVYADGKVYPLKIIIHKKEKITVPAGEFNCLKVEPILKYEGIFKQKGRLIVWFTDDNLKIPVKMTSKVIIGSIGSNLETYTLGTTK